MNESALWRGTAASVMQEWPADVAQLVFTSPPYNVGWSYQDDPTADRLPFDQYLKLLARLVRDSYRVLRPGGVLVLNLPQTIRPHDDDNRIIRSLFVDPAFPDDGYEQRSFPLAAWAVMQMLRVGFLLREQIVWVKSKGDVEVRATSTAIGAYSNPYLRPCHEMLLVGSKATCRIPEREAKWPGERSIDQFRSYLEVCKDVWSLKPGRAAQGEPLAWPEELVSRTLKLFSNRGDLVVDPFAGTGSTLRYGLLLGRVVWTIERSPAYWPRLEAILGQSVMFGETA